jgi:hypothetical protein
MCRRKSHGIDHEYRFFAQNRSIHKSDAGIGAHARVRRSGNAQVVPSRVLGTRFPRRIRCFCFLARIIFGGAVMTRGRWIAVSCVAAIAAWYWLSFPTYSHRYRLTIAVETDGQVHSASSVIEVRFRFWPQFLAGLAGGNQYAVDVRGQAVLVDLDAHGALVASLRSYSDRAAVDARWLALRAFNPQSQMPQGGYVVTKERLRGLPEPPARAELTADNLPQLIWFKDVADQRTARPIKAIEFSAAIAEGARLTSAKIEMTDDPIVIDIDKKLPWYRALEKSQKEIGSPFGGTSPLSYNMFVGA